MCNKSTRLYTSECIGIRTKFACFVHRHPLLFQLSAAGSIGAQRVHNVATFGPGRADSFRGIAFRPARANQVHRNPRLVFFSVFTFAAVSEVLQQSSKARQPRCNSRASRFYLCDSHGRCSAFVRERVCVYAILEPYSSRNTVSQSVSMREVQCHIFPFFCAQCILHLLLCTCITP